MLDPPITLLRIAPPNLLQVRELQRGSHAAVYMVRKVQTGDLFAMKVLETARARAHRLATERKVPTRATRTEAEAPPSLAARNAPHPKPRWPHVASFGRC